MSCEHIDHVRFGPTEESRQKFEEQRSAAIDRLVEAIRRQQGEAMHYMNGREAKNGDKVMLIPAYGPPMVGILYDAVGNNDYCNGRLAPVSPSDPCPNLQECLHIDDVLSALSTEKPAE